MTDVILTAPSKPPKKLFRIFSAAFGMIEATTYETEAELIKKFLEDTTPRIDFIGTDELDQSVRHYFLRPELKVVGIVIVEMAQRLVQPVHTMVGGQPQGPRKA